MKRRQSLCPGGLAVSRYNNRLRSFNDGLTWCFVAGNFLKVAHDTSGGIPQWQSGESHWMSEHPWVTAGHWPWRPSNHPSERGGRSSGVRTWTRGLVQDRAVGSKGPVQRPYTSVGIYSHAALASDLPKITGIHWLVMYLGVNSASCRFLCCQRRLRYLRESMLKVASKVS